ncbi:MAG: tRNA (adenosine(37)-N6)-threonylcarbamoyltransferase complex transferase subunit TsaD [bacterium]
MFITLGIETSCDDTSLALVNQDGQVLGMVSQDQEEFHREYGGVVPEIASRIHLEVINPLFTQLLKKTGIAPEQIDLVAVTSRPGLLGSLLIGMTFAKTFSLVYKKPIVGVNHLKGHLLSPGLNGGQIEYPNASLIVSGGHTDLFKVNSSNEFEMLGATRDDAAGEVIDKLGRTLGLGFPAGMKMDKLARDGNPDSVELPRPMIKSDDLDFSFSGLKTAAVIYLRCDAGKSIRQKDFVASLEAAIVDVLIAKLKSAVKKTGVKAVNVAGGVSANSLLRNRLAEWCENENLKLSIPPIEYCMDNGAMIALAGHSAFLSGHRDDMSLDCMAVCEWE